MASATFTPEVLPVEGQPAKVTLEMTLSEVAALRRVLFTEHSPARPRNPAIRRLQFALKDIPPGTTFNDF